MTGVVWGEVDPLPQQGHQDADLRGRGEMERNTEVASVVSDWGVSEDLGRKESSGFGHVGRSRRGSTAGGQVCRGRWSVALVYLWVEAY